MSGLFVWRFTISLCCSVVSVKLDGHKPMLNEGLTDNTIVSRTALAHGHCSPCLYLGKLLCSNQNGLFSINQIFYDKFSDNFQQYIRSRSFCFLSTFGHTGVIKTQKTKNNYLLNYMVDPTSLANIYTSSTRC